MVCSNSLDWLGLMEYSNRISSTLDQIGPSGGGMKSSVKKAAQVFSIKGDKPVGACVVRHNGMGRHFAGTNSHNQGAVRNQKTGSKPPQPASVCEHA